MADVGTRRIGDLIGMRVVPPSGRSAAAVVDVRVRWSMGGDGRAQFRVEGLIVGPERAGSLLGYDRDQERGPAVVAALVRLVHRRTFLVVWDEVERIDWADRVVTIHVEPSRSPDEGRVSTE